MQHKEIEHVSEPYRRLLVMSLLSFAAMYLLMYAMVNASQNVVGNWNEAYMAGLMSGAMVLLELLVMRAMYRHRGWNVLAASLALLLLAGGGAAIRKQMGIGDRQLLRAMIPHHGGAILMCRQASLSRPEVRELCVQIVTSQEREIVKMRQMLAETP